MNYYEASLADLLDQRVGELRKFARWYKSQPDPRRWRDLRLDADQELRILLRLRRKAQSVATSRPDPIQQYRAYRDWTEAELREAFA